jgi:aldehyde:ferredoxin oxidoreductase
MTDCSHGWTGKILHVDLSSGRTWVEPTANYADRFLGGKGINQAILFEQVPAGTGPFDPQNRVIVGTGPLTGTLAPSCGRVTIGSMNAFNRGVAEANSGGHLGPEIKYAGFDHVLIHGRAERPVYLWIRDDHVALRDADEIWRATTWEAEEWIKRDVHEPHLHTALIGPAGANLVRGSAVIIDRGRAAGRGGIGAVMGSKNLKGLAVRGSGAVRVAQPDRFMRAVEAAWEALARSPKQNIMHAGGTHLDGTQGANRAGMMSVRNAQDAFWAQDRIERVDYPVYAERFEKRRLACFACPTFCSHVYALRGGPYGPLITEGFQANTIWGFGARVDLADPEALIAIHARNSQLGLDNDFAAVAISWAIELYERGLLTTADTDGLQLAWGDAEAVIELQRRIAHREGIGDLLAEGVMRAAQELGRGSDRFAVHVKGQDCMDEIRTAVAWGFGVVLALKGGGHVEGSCNTEQDGTSDVQGQEWFGVPTLDPHSYAGKERMVYWFERYKQMLDSVGLCYFTGPIIDTGRRVGPPEIAELLSAAVGREYSADELLLYGRRAHNVQKAFNTLHAGFTRADDLPPRRFVEEPVKTGPHAGARIDLDEWERMLDRYYRLHGWDPATSWPLPQTLEELDLSDVADRLRAADKLAISGA